MASREFRCRGLRLTGCKEGRAMKSDQLTFRTGFRISIGNGRSQAAEMVLTAGGKEGATGIRATTNGSWNLRRNGALSLGFQARLAIRRNSLASRIGRA